MEGKGMTFHDRLGDALATAAFTMVLLPLGGVLLWALHNLMLRSSWHVLNLSGSARHVPLWSGDRWIIFWLGLIGLLVGFFSALFPDKGGI